MTFLLTVGGAIVSCAIRSRRRRPSWLRSIALMAVPHDPSDQRGTGRSAFAWCGAGRRCELADVARGDSSRSMVIGEAATGIAAPRSRLSGSRRALPLLAASWTGAGT
jgi:hypothetical protein